MKGMGSGGISQYILGHKSLENKGKTYKEIYGTDNPGCGYQKGEANIATRPEIREKIKVGVLKSYHNTETGATLRNLRRDVCPFNKSPYLHGVMRLLAFDGQKYRSSYEVLIANLFYINNIPFVKEVKYHLNGNGLKIVDFVVNNMLIEVTGYGRKEWREHFNKQMKLLHETRKENILVIMGNRANSPLFEQYIKDNGLNRITVIPLKNASKILEYVYDQQAIRI